MQIRTDFGHLIRLYLVIRVRASSTARSGCSCGIAVVGAGGQLIGIGRRVQRNSRRSERHVKCGVDVKYKHFVVAHRIAQKRAIGAAHSDNWLYIALLQQRAYGNETRRKHQYKPGMGDLCTAKGRTDFKRRVSQTGDNAEHIFQSFAFFFQLECILRCFVISACVAGRGCCVERCVSHRQALVFSAHINSCLGPTNATNDVPGYSCITDFKCTVTCF
jgi:hypothetical protein